MLACQDTARVAGLAPSQTVPCGSSSSSSRTEPGDMVPFCSAASQRHTEQNRRRGFLLFFWGGGVVEVEVGGGRAGGVRNNMWHKLFPHQQG